MRIDDVPCNCLPGFEVPYCYIFYTSPWHSSGIDCPHSWSSSSRVLFNIERNVEVSLSVFPIFLFFVIVTIRLALLQSPPLVLLGDLVSGEHLCADESCFKISCREIVRRLAKPFETHDAINSHAINESKNTR
jgi:hypothetical protein